MLKLICIFGLLVFTITGLQLKHEAAINIQQLTDVQKAADTFIRQQVANVASASLVEGEQNDNTFKYSYMKQTTPVSLTQVTAFNQGNNQFKLINVLQSISGPVQGGRMTSVTQAYQVTDLNNALEKLGWNK